LSGPLCRTRAGQDQRKNQTAGGCHVGIDEDQCDRIGFADVGDLQFRAAIKAEPAKPQDSIDKLTGDKA